MSAVLVTGASTGIGRACAERLATAGHTVYAGVRSESDAERLRQEAPAPLQPLLLDITDEEAVRRAFERIGAETGGRLAGVVNNAGIAVAGPVEFTGTDHWRRQFEVNLFGHVSVTRSAIPLLRRDRGRIVFMSSLGGRLAQPFIAPYTASKFALEALADSLRLELRPWRVSVSLVEPGAVRTPIWAKSLAAADILLGDAPPEIHRLYGVAVEAATRASRRSAERGVEPGAVADAVEHALTASRPRTRYVVGREARIGVLAARLLPDRLRDELLLRLVGLPRHEADTVAAEMPEPITIS